MHQKNLIFLFYFSHDINLEEIPQFCKVESHLRTGWTFVLGQRAERGNLPTRESIRTIFWITVTCISFASVSNKELRERKKILKIQSIII